MDSRGDRPETSRPRDETSTLSHELSLMCLFLCPSLALLLFVSLCLTLPSAWLFCVFCPVVSWDAVAGDLLPVRSTIA